MTALRAPGLLPQKSAASVSSRCSVIVVPRLPITGARWGAGATAGAAAHSPCSHAVLLRAMLPAAAAAGATASAGALPRSPVEQAEQAAAAVTAALDAGVRRQLLWLLLPVNEKEADFMATEPVGVGEGIVCVCMHEGGEGQARGAQPWGDAMGGRPRQPAATC